MALCSEEGCYDIALAIDGRQDPSVSVGIRWFDLTMPGAGRNLGSDFPQIGILVEISVGFVV